MGQLRAVMGMVVTVLTLGMIMAAGPALVWIAHAVVPAAIVVGAVVCVVRIVWRLTDRDRW